jgi:GntR family transcriptional regulator
MLPFSVALRPGDPIQEQVVYAVTRAVVSGQLRPGDAFPSVRVLSQELGINPNTAHRIVGVLIADGILVVRPGVGTIVADESRGLRTERRQSVEDDVERIVIESKRAGLSLQELLAAVRRQWGRIVRRAG